MAVAPQPEPPGPSVPAPATWTVPAPRWPTELRTSEGRLTLVLQVLLLLNTTQVWHYMSPRYSAIAQGILGAGYAIARGLAKTGSAGLR